MYRSFFDFWIKVAESKQIPILFTKFEDFITKKEDVLKQIFKFSLRVASVEGLYIEQRIKEVVAEEDKIKLYRPNARKGQVNLLTKENIDYIKSELKDILLYFGYATTEDSASPYFYDKEFTESELN